MCARLEIRMAYSQAYRAQANGRAEVAGKTIIRALRKLSQGGQMKWPEVLPRALWTYHNTPGESGLSPFRVVFGRDRYEAGSPYEPLRECEAAQSFFERVEQIDRKVAETLNQLHQTRQKRLNAKRKERPPYSVGDYVWVLRPRDSPSTEKLDTWWLGPAQILERLGEHSYRAQVKPNMSVEVHSTQLKPFVEDDLAGKPTELFHFLPTYQELGTTMGEWNVDAILDHRWFNGRLQFLTRWEGGEENSDSWEPVGSFFARYCYELVQYCQKKKLQLDLADYLKGFPSE